MRGRRLTLAVACLLACLCVAAPAAADVSDFGLESVAASLSSNRAGDHADLTTTFDLTGDPSEPDIGGHGRPFAEMRDAQVELPPGFVANLAGFAVCPMEAFEFGNQPGNACGSATQVGAVRFSLYNGLQNVLASLYRLPAPSGGDVVARFGFWAAIVPVTIDVRIDPERNYAVTATASGSPASITVLPTTVSTTIWGDPTDHSHDDERPTPFESFHCGGSCEERASGLAPTAFATNPTSCGPGSVDFAVDSYQVPGVFDSKSAQLPEITNCARVPFEPALSLSPTTRSAGSASGVDFSLRLPQDGLTNPSGISSADLKKAVVRLPQGVGLNASAADGLGSCSEAQIGLVSESPVRFNDAAPSCPESSKVGSATITTPILEEPLEGSLYVAQQGDNPFHSLLAGYMVAKANGIVLKVAGKFELSPSGRITAVFDDNPQAPFSDLELHFKGGDRGVLTLPAQCGTYQTEYELTPWSGNAPVAGSSAFTVEGNCGAGFNPGFEAGTTNPAAGRYSPFVLRLTRQPGSQQLKGLSVSPPAGLLAKLAGIPYCPDSALAGISTQPGAGALQLASPSCPAASRVGSVTAGAGSGSPFYVSTGKAYLAGPYEGAPLSLAIVTPAVAGPFDLGNVVVRAALHVDPETARVRAVSDPLPTILQGIPLDLRDVRVNLDRPGFALNPTSCEAMGVAARVTSEEGSVADRSDRFQVGGCQALGFKPKLSLRLAGKTNRGAHPALRATLTMPAGGANIAKASVALPRSEFLDQAHIRTICTRVQFAEGNGNGEHCPPGSIYGHARAITPLLDKPLEGPVYLRSSSHELPDLVAALNGQIHIDLDARIDSIKHGGIRSRFEAVPDAPVSKFVLTMRGGAKGLLQNSTNLCIGAHRATAKFAAHSGKAAAFKPRLLARCRQGRKRGRSSHGHG